MSVDVLILNTAVADFRGPEFSFTDTLVGPGGLAKCPTAMMPAFSQAQLCQWIQDGRATAGGPGNVAPLLARAGLNVAVGVNLGRGEFGGMDAQGRFFFDTMTAHGVDMSATFVHPDLPTGSTFIHDKGNDERGGIAYFPNANNDFNFACFRKAVTRLQPRIVYYMYSGLSDRGDAHGGRSLAEFIAWCRAGGALTIVDSHTLTGDPGRLIADGVAVPEYRLLIPLLPCLDLFFTSTDEAMMIVNTLGQPRRWADFSTDDNIRYALGFLTDTFWTHENRARLFGVTFSGGAWAMACDPQGKVRGPQRVASRFLAGEVIDLVGAGDSFRSGVITDVAHHIEEFKAGTLDFERSIQLGNLFASLFIKAPLHDRYAGFKPYEKMIQLIEHGGHYAGFADLLRALE